MLRAPENGELASVLTAACCCAVVVVLLVHFVSRATPKSSRSSHAVLAAVVAMASLQFAGLDFIATVRSVQSFVSDSSGALFDGGMARDLAAGLALSDTVISNAANEAARQLPLGDGFGAAMGAASTSPGAVRCVIAAIGYLLLVAGKRHAPLVITGTSFVLALGTLSLNSWTGPPWVAAHLGEGRVHDPTSAAVCALVIAFGSHAFFQYFAAAWCAAVGWLSVSLVAVALVALANHADTLVGLSSLTAPLLRDVKLMNPLNADSWDALQARASHWSSDTSAPWSAVKALWPSATDVAVICACTIAFYACFYRFHAFLRALEDATVRRALPEWLYQLLVPSRVLTPVATGVFFCAVTHHALELRAVEALHSSAAGEFLRPRRDGHEFVFLHTSLGSLAAAFFQAGVSVHSLETVGYAQDKMEAWITAIVGGSILLTVALGLLDEHLGQHEAGDGNGSTNLLVYSACFWGWLLLVRYGISKQLGSGTESDDGDDFAESVAAVVAAPSHSSGRPKLTPTGRFDAHFAGSSSSEFYDDEEGKEAVTPPTSQLRGRAMHSSGGSRRRSKTPVRRRR